MNLKKGNEFEYFIIYDTSSVHACRVVSVNVDDKLMSYRWHCNQNQNQNQQKVWLTSD